MLSMASRVTNKNIVCVCVYVQIIIYIKSKTKKKREIKPNTWSDINFSENAIKKRYLQNFLRYNFNFPKSRRELKFYDPTILNPLF